MSTETTQRELLTTDAMCERFGCHRTTIHRMVRSKRLPKPLKLSAGKSGRLRWDAAEVDAAISRLAA